MYLKSIITLIVLLVNSVCYGYVIQNIEQEGIDYKRYGEPYYPGDKLSSRDTLVYPINYEISLKVIEIKNVDIKEPYFNADFYYEIKSDYPKEYVSSYNESIDLDPLNWVIAKGFSNEEWQEPQINIENGAYVFSKYGEAKVSHKWDFRKYPFDVQKLKFSFITQVDTSAIKLSNSLNKKMGYPINNEFLSDGYTIDTMYSETSYIKTNEDILVSPNTNRKLVKQKVTYIIELSRRGSWLYLKLFFGAFVAFFISWILFFIPQRQFESRTNLAVAAVFGALGNKYFITTQIPNVQVLTKVDIINNVIILLIAYNILIMIAQQNKRMKWSILETDKGALVKTGVLFIISMVIIRLWP